MTLEGGGARTWRALPLLDLGKEFLYSRAAMVDDDDMTNHLNIDLTLLADLDPTLADALRIARANMLLPDDTVRYEIRWAQYTRLATAARLVLAQGVKA